jgi:branched-chain amino acid transport system permease protein
VLYVSLLISGILLGSVYALSSLGIVLTYKTVGIFNFAYGGVAMFCGYVFWQLRDQWHLHQWFALPILLLVVAPLIGVVLEAVFRPLAAASAEVQIVVALGILSFIITVVPVIFGGSEQSLSSIFPSGGFKLGHGGLVITWDNLLTFLLVGVLALLLYVLLRRTRMGMATRAVVDNRDLAEMMGVSSSLIGRAAWIVSVIFAAIAGILLSSQQGLNTTSLLALTLYSFAPAVIGRLTSFPLAGAGAVALGVVQSFLGFYSSSGLLAQVEGSIPYLALFVVLVLYGTQLKEVRSSLRAPVISTISGSRLRGVVQGVGLAVVAGVVVPQFLSGAIVRDLSDAMAYTVVALTLVVVMGWTGQISIAQMSFAGVGAFAVAHVAGSHPGMFFPGLLLGMALALPLGLAVGLPSLRLSGLFLGLATMGFALIMDNLVFTQTSISGGLTGITLAKASVFGFDLSTPSGEFYLCLAFLTVAAVGAYLMRRSPVGRRLQMVRDSPAAASTLGVSLTVTKLAVFAVGAMVAAAGGSLLAVSQQVVDPNNFSFQTSLELLLVVVVGGRTLVGGALVAGGLDLVTLLPLPTAVARYLPLAVAWTVIMVANNPEGVITVAARQARYCLAPLYRRRPDRPYLPPELVGG